MNKLFSTALLIASAAAAVPALAQSTYTVDGAGGADFTTIQAAIDAASDGDTINVNPGTYDEAIVLNKSLNLIGDSAATTTLTYTDTGNTSSYLFFLGTNAGSQLNGSVLIENFTFYNGGGLAGDNNMLRYRAKPGVGGDITIRNNVFDGDGDGTATPALGIAAKTESFNISGNAFSGTSYAIYLDETSGGVIDGNTFTDTRAVGLDPGEISDVAITNNDIDVSDYGIVLGADNQNIDISMNDITGASSTAILWWDPSGSQTHSNISINYNNIYGNAEGIAAFGDPSGDPVPLETINAEYNWWGDASGPSGDGTGAGDSVQLDNVDYTPWLTQPVPEPTSLALLAIGGLAVLRRRRSA